MFKQIRIRIIATIMSATFAALVIIGSLSFYISKKTVYKSNSNVVLESSNESARMIDEYIKLETLLFRSADFNNQLAVDIVTNNGTLNDDTQKRISLYCSSCEGLLNFSVLSEDKKLLYSFSSNEPDKPAERTFSGFDYQPGGKKDIFVFMSEETKSDFNILLPIFYSNKLCGFQLIRIAGKELNDMLSSQYSCFGTREWHSFIDSKGNFVNSQSEAAFDTQKYAKDFKSEPLRTFDNKYFAVKKQTNCGLSFITMLSAENYNTTLREMLTFLILVGLVLLVIALAIAIIFADGITRPLSAIYNKIKSADGLDGIIIKDHKN